MPDTPYIPRAKGTSAQQQREWRQRNDQPIDLLREKEYLLALLEAVRTEPALTSGAYDRLVRREARRHKMPIISKSRLRRGYLALINRGLLDADDDLLLRLRMKPTRTLSGVAPVTVLTRPYPCPGKCIFCPDDRRMPKSYLSNEPGAMRALMLDFDPYDQTYQRLQAMQRIGHTTDKVELLVLGGTWSAYPRVYQAWFVRRCFDAMNGEPADCGETPSAQGTLEQEMALLSAAHEANEQAGFRNVGLVIETRPDRITTGEVRWLRQLGVTRVQLGVQSLDDDILRQNRRGHTVAQTRQAIRLLRGAGFKVAVHWMPNLLGATPETDLVDFRRWWDDPSLRPDEMKIYPTGLLRGTELYRCYQKGCYRSYTEPELTDLLAACKKLVPRTCRLNRVMRDIPAPEIVDGVTTSNLRQAVQARLCADGTPCQCIRCREVRWQPVDPACLVYSRLDYDTDHSHEVFLEASTHEDRLAGFLRLSLPVSAPPLVELEGAALIRQVQVYGPAAAFDDGGSGFTQHQGVGRRLIQQATDIASAAGYRRIAVIAAIGTREYYRRLGFTRDGLYMSRAF
jgi:elongator complex protein 3